MSKPVEDSMILETPDEDAFTEIETMIDSQLLNEMTPDKIPGYISQRVLPLALSVQDESFAEAVFGIAVGHPQPLVRAGLIDFVQAWLPDPTAVDALFTMITDPDDLVCLKAMKVAGTEKVEAVAHYLIDVAGRPSQRTAVPGSPVGRGAAHALTAVTHIVGHDNIQQQHSLEDYLMENRRLPDELGGVLVLSEKVERDFSEAREPGMRLIPGGWSEIGLHPDSIPDRTFDWVRAFPARQLWLPPYFIDSYPVTVAEYDMFSDSVQAADHVTCHPLEPAGKIHHRNTLGDIRAGSDHPVTGIDWFDAYAYARWVHKTLPTEYQWERAARGPQNLVWPWGNEWYPDSCNWAETAFGHRFTSVEEWRCILADTTSTSPGQTTTPVHSHDAHQSGYGIYDLVGNAWEWTRSELKTGRYYSPTLHDRHPEDRISVVLKGGSWSSLPGMMFPSYRGQDAPFCRHNEIGFRCVKQLPMTALHEAGLGWSIRNTAIY